MALLFAFIVWLGPCWILIYLRQYKKGNILMALNLLTMFAFCAWLGKAAAPYLPAGFNTQEASIYREITQKYIIPNHSVTFYIYQGLLGGIWVYSVVAAILAILHRRKPTGRAEDNDKDPEV